MNRIQENTTQYTTGEGRPVDKIKKTFTNITLADQEVSIDNQDWSIIFGSKMDLKGPNRNKGAKQHLLNF